ncbi:MAG: DNA (cytosine-5-)-methyltransferase, partial [Veillonella sp.]|nr:DNA (cytosine-5-)-methyltransferase [Veillonella sp.]
MAKAKFRFIDLFCGIGGFHQALSSFGGECVFAAEIDKDCIDVYLKNYGLDAAHDMTKVEAKRVPTHEILCGGFPCQAFSKAGKQAGVNDTRGTLFFEIERLLRYHRPQFILLENVRNLVSHDDGRTWKIITDVLKDIGYRLTEDPLILSPHQFGVPQLRERVYIVGKYDPDNVGEPLDISFSDLKGKEDLSIYDILEDEPVSENCRISDEELKVLTAWDEFYQGINLKVIGFPVNTSYFHYS